MTSHRKRAGRRSHAPHAVSSRGPARERLAQLLSTTTRRLLAVGVVTGAVAGVLALLPKPKPAPEVRVVAYSAPAFH